MRKFQLVVISITLLTGVFWSTESAACKRKKKRKAKQTEVVQAKPVASEDSVVVVRNPGVIDPVGLDSIKRVKSELKRKTQLVVSFISMGTGIDGQAHAKFKSAIENFNKKNKCKLIYDVKTWGREGERDYCFSNNDEKLMTAFNSEISTLFKDNRRVFVEKNKPCR